MSVLRDDYHVPLRDSSPPLSCTPVSFLTCRAGSPRAPALRQEVEAMLAKRALGIALEPGLSFSSRPLPGGEGVSELVSCGRSLSPERVHPASPLMRVTVASVLLSVRERDFLDSLDLKDASFQITIPLSSRKLLRVISERTVSPFGACGFGLSTTPQVFTGVFVTLWVPSHGIRLLRYLDDWLVLAFSGQEANWAVRSSSWLLSGYHAFTSLTLVSRQRTLFCWPHLLRCYESQLRWIIVLWFYNHRWLGNWEGYPSSIISPPARPTSAEFLRVLCYYMAQSLRDGATLAGQDCLSPRSERRPFSHLLWYLVQGLCDGVTLFGSSLRCELTHSIGTKAYPVCLS